MLAIKLGLERLKGLSFYLKKKKSISCNFHRVIVIQGIEEMPLWETKRKRYMTK